MHSHQLQEGGAEEDGQPAGGRLDVRGGRVDARVEGDGPAEGDRAAGAAA